MVTFRGKKYYTMQEVADMFGVTVNTVYNWNAKKKFKTVKVSKHAYVSEEEMNKYLKSMGL